MGKVFREGLTAIRDEIVARDPSALPGATSNHCYFCWYVLSKAVVPVASPRSGRISLPLLGQPWMPPE